MEKREGDQSFRFLLKKRIKDGSEDEHATRKQGQGLRQLLKNQLLK